MPWHIAKGHGCSGAKPWAVVKDSDGSKVGCHATEESAKAQLAALYASERAEQGWAHNLIPEKP